MKPTDKHLPAARESRAAVSARLPKHPVVVGIGASAGGLEALEQFFSAVSPGSGLIFVVVQHMAPDKKSALAELLQRASAIPVTEIEDGMRAEPNCCYIAPPGVELSLTQGVFHVVKQAAPRGRSHLIDAFLNSLALDKKECAAAVILSGMDADGTDGARAVKAHGGVVFVQSPPTAEFDVMPRSAIRAELADVVAAPAELPARIAAYFTHMHADGKQEEEGGTPGLALEKILSLVKAQTGHDFSLYKKGTVYRRIQRRMAIHQLGTFDEYLQHVRHNAIESELLYKELLIGVTSFFRDPEVWEDLQKIVIPQLLAQRAEGSTLRAWVAACSTGEEAYTLAMVFAEAVAQMENPEAYALQIFATDLDKDAIAKARQGLYPDSIASEVSAARLERFFIHGPDGYRVTTQIRGMVVFAQQSIASDPPFAKLDILTCRNLLIYLESDLQKKLFPLFQHSLNPNGVLVLGSAETVGKAADLFTAIDPRMRIYRRSDSAAQWGRGLRAHEAGSFLAPLPSVSLPRHPTTAESLQTLADQVLVRKYAPSAVLVTVHGDIVYFSGKTGKYLEPAVGKANLNLFAMARPGLSLPLNEVFHRAIRNKEAAVIDEVTLSADGSTQTFKVTVEPIDSPQALRDLVMVVFADVAPRLPADVLPPARKGQDKRLDELTQELTRSRDEHQSTREEMQIVQEGLLSTNEELQSANEELTTSREEMQSVNEELQTVNAELQARVDALGRASDDMENLLNSTEIATLFLDQHLNVRRYTTRATSLIKLIPGDVGRPITDIVSDMDHASLADDAREVLKTLMFKEKQVSATEGRWFMVRTMPYRTQDNRIDGVVITFSDISVAKRLEATLRETSGGQP